MGLNNVFHFEATTLEIYEARVEDFIESTL
jgi:hypothetical protein